MRKTFKLFLCVVALCMGVNAWGTDTSTSYDFETNLSGWTCTGGVTQLAASSNLGGKTISGHGGSNIVQVAFSSLDAVETMTSTVNFTKIKSISFKITGSDRTKSTIKIDVNSSAEFTGDNTSILATTVMDKTIGDATIGSNGKMVVATIDLQYTLPSGYIRFTFGETNTGKYVGIDDIVVTTTDDEIQSLPAPTFDAEFVKSYNTTYNENVVLVGTANNGSSYSWYACDAEGNVNGEELATTENYTYACNQENAQTIYFKVTATNATGSASQVIAVNIAQYVGRYQLTSNAVSLNIKQSDVSSNGYLTVSTSNWSNGYYNMSAEGRTLTIKVSNVAAVAVYVKNTSAGRTYKLTVGSNSAETITHPGSIDGSDIVCSGIYPTGSTGEVDIVLGGGGNSVYPDHIILYSVAPNYTIGTSGWSTFCAPYNCKISGVTAYKAAVNGSDIELTALDEGDIIKAGTGLLIGGNSGATYTVTANAATATANVSGNALKGAILPVAFDDVENTMYVLKANTAEFHPAISGVLPAGKAYFDIDDPLAASAQLRIVTPSGIATDIKNATLTKATKALVNGNLVVIRNGATFNLNGMLVK